jgi:hypothetical protein
MSSKRKKLRNRLARQVIDGEITVAAALARLGLQAARKSAAPSLAKAESARPAWPGQPPAARYPGDDLYMRAAFAPIPRPAVTKAADPAARQAPQQLLKSMRDLAAVTETPARPAHYWTGIDRGLQRESVMNPDPVRREEARAALAARLEGTADAQ